MPVSEEAADPAAPRSFARATAQVAVVLIGMALGLWALYRLRGVLLLLVLAVFFAYLVGPLVRLLRRPIARWRGFVLPLPLTIGVIYAAIFGALAASVVPIGRAHVST